MKISPFFSALIVVVLLFGCGRANKADNTEVDSSPEQVGTASSIIGTSWKLIILAGAEVPPAPNQQQAIHFVLQEDAKVTGYTGCNRFNGTYSLEAGNRIRFSKMASTRMACPETAVKESDFLQVFELADNYTVNEDKLMLNVGRRAPLAVFEAADF